MLLSLVCWALHVPLGQLVLALGFYLSLGGWASQLSRESHLRHCQGHHHSPLTLAHTQTDKSDFTGNKYFKMLTDVIEKDQ